jgi:uncharacterized membrane-anchored protein YitT (DUF2179 family)
MNRSVLNRTTELIKVAFGVLLASIGLKAFLLPNGFLDGGATGIAILLNELTSFDISLLLILISIPFFILGWFTVSRWIFIKSLLSIISLSLLIHFENFQPVTEDKLLISIFGGLFLGAGIGVSIRSGAVLDGSEILGLFINERFGISIGKVILLFNVILFSVTAFFLSLEVAMYSVLTFLVTAKIIDLIIQGFEDYLGLTIISKKSIIIQDKLINEVGTGITVYKGERGYGKTGHQEEVEIIQTIINRIDIQRTMNIINSVDEQAFIIEFDVNQVRGGIKRKLLKL